MRLVSKKSSLKSHQAITRSILEQLEGRTLLSTALTYGGIAQGSIGAAGATAQYTFDAAAGNLVELNLITEASGPRIYRLRPGLQTLRPAHSLLQRQRRQPPHAYRKRHLHRRRQRPRRPPGRHLRPRARRHHPQQRRHHRPAQRRHRRRPHRPQHRGRRIHLQRHRRRPGRTQPGQRFRQRRRLRGSR